MDKKKAKKVRKKVSRPVAKKALPAPKKAVATGSKVSSVGGLRAQIDHLDREINQLINKRAATALRIGKLKNSGGQRVYDPGREDEVLTNAVAANKGPLSDHAVRAIFRELISGSRALEKVVRVAFLGPVYSFSHLAAIEKFGQSVEFVPVGSIAAVFEAVNRSQVDNGLVPIENSTDGRVADTLEMFTRLPLKICAEVQLHIHHNLLGRCTQAEVSEVYSRPQALSQCREWLGKNLPQARIIEVTSTSTAAQLARDKPGAAAVASQQAAVEYGLNVLASSIEDNPRNVTRFAIIGHEIAARTGKDKTAVMFQIPHQPGSLADALVAFKRSKVNMTWIESFPLKGPEKGYSFFGEFEGHDSDARVKRAIAALENKAVRMEILGSYPRAEPID